MSSLLFKKIAEVYFSQTNALNWRICSYIIIQLVYAKIWFVRRAYWHSHVCPGTPLEAWVFISVYNFEFTDAPLIKPTF